MCSSDLQHERGWNKHLEYPYHIYHQTGTLLNSLLKQQGDDFLQRLAAHMYEIPLHIPMRQSLWRDRWIVYKNNEEHAKFETAKISRKHWIITIDEQICGTVSYYYEDAQKKWL